MKMQLPRPNFLLFLVCACGAVNVLFYTLTNGPTELRGADTEYKFIDLQDTDTIRKADVSKDALNSPYYSNSKGKSEYTAALMNDTRTQQHAARQLKNANDKELQYAQYSPDGNLRTFSFSINKYDLCVDKILEIERFYEFNMTIVVLSDIQNFIRRHAIRNTWGSTLRDINSSLLFMVGRSLNDEFQTQVEKEAELYSDVIQVDIIDSYKNLPLKSIAMLQWLNDYCMSSKYYLKADDDVFINIQNTLKAVRSRGENRFFLCHVFNRAEPIRNENSKWYTSIGDYNRTFFPTYCSGTTYAFSSSILSDIYTSSLTTKLFAMEDVFITGLAAENLNISHVHSDGISYTKRPHTGCEYEHALSGHQVPVKQMYVIFAQLTSKEIDCDTHENRLLKSDDENI